MSVGRSLMISALLFTTFGICTQVTFAQSYMRSLNVHEFDPALVERIVRPDTKALEPFSAEKHQHLIQYPFIAGKMMEGLMSSLDQSVSIKRQMQHNYGLNDYNVSYVEDQPSTWAKVGDHKSGVSPNCFMCHSTYINGKFIPGLGNTRIDLRKFLNDLIFKNPTANIAALPQLEKSISKLYKDQTGSQPNSFLDRTAMLGSVIQFITDSSQQSLAAGTSNPWGFAEYLVSWRDDNMDYWHSQSLIHKKSGRNFKAGEVVIDPMPWWQLKYKQYINWDGLMKKSARVIVQASLSPGRSGPEIRNMDELFSYIYDEVHRMEAPVYPHLEQLNPELVAKGEKVFNRVCAECHGKHSENGVYYRDPKDFRDPAKGHYFDEIIHLKHLGTDKTRVQALNLPYINAVEKTWLGHDGDKEYAFRVRQVLQEYFDNPSKKEIKSLRYLREYCQQHSEEDCTQWLTPEMKEAIYGYQVPPLWGIWASAPYFHNGSVPNLRAVLFPEERPAIWKLKDDPKTNVDPYTPYNTKEPGLMIETNLARNPTDTKIYEVTNPGCSNRGHDIQDWSKTPSVPFTESEKLEILEYLKTL